MKPTITILIGAPVHGTEAAAVQRLYFDLCNRGITALLMVNFFAYERQVDCLAATNTRALLLDFKHITGPLSGGTNGKWVINQHGGSKVRYAGDNPYIQVVETRLRLTDSMRSYAQKSGLPKPKDYDVRRFLDAAVCICPDIRPQSQLPPGDFKCWIWGYPVALNEICTGVKRFCWTIEQWKSFAAEHLSLEEVTLESAINPVVRQAELQLSAYLHRLIEFLTYALPPELPGAESLPVESHFLLNGSRGIGKTIKLKRYAAEIARQGHFIIFCDAGLYSGDFAGLLRKSVAPYSPKSPEQLLQAAELCGESIVLVIDEYDKCVDALRPRLIQDLMSFFEKCTCRVVVGSRCDPHLPPSLRAISVTISEITREQKLAVFSYYCPRMQCVDGTILDPFDNVRSVMIAAQCRSQLVSVITQTDLLDSYIACTVPSQYTTVISALYRHVAAMIHKSNGSTLTTYEFDNQAVSFMNKANAPLSLIDELRNSPLVDVSVCSFAFNHAIIQRHFAADALFRSAPNNATLALEVAKADNSVLSGPILSRLKSSDAIQAVLRVVTDSSTLDHAFSGKWGDLVRHTLRADCLQLMRDATADLLASTLEITLAQGVGNQSVLQRVELKRQKCWTDYENRLARLLGRHLDDSEFTDTLAEMLQITGILLNILAYNEARTQSVSAAFVFERLCKVNLFERETVMECPIVTMIETQYHVAHASTKHYISNSPWLKALVCRLDRGISEGELTFVLYALCRVLCHCDDVSFDLVKRTRLLCCSHAFPSLTEVYFDMVKHWSSRNLKTY